MSPHDDESEIKFLKTMIRAVLLRPKMFTTNGSFDEVIAFLDGYYARHNPKAVQWGDFLQFVATKLNSKDYDNRSIFQNLKSQSAESSLDQLLKWSEEFEKTLPESS